MAFSQQETQQIQNLKSKGYTSKEIIDFIGAQRIGGTSLISEEEKERSAFNESFNQKSFLDKASAPGKFLLGEESISALGRGLATGPLGEFATGQTSETLLNPETGVQAPTRKEVGGALLQTGALVADVALAPATLSTQIAAGVGLGYVYDVGSNMVADKNTYRAGAATIAGALVPPALKGVARGGGALFGAARRLGQEPVEEAVTTLGQKAEDLVPEGALGQKVREIGEIPKRIGRRIEEGVEETAERATYRGQTVPASQEAIDMGLELDTVKFYDGMDNTTKQAVREMISIADDTRSGVRPEIVAGRVKGEQLDLIINKRKEIGTKLGELSDALPNQSVQMLPTHRNLRSILINNQIKPFRDELKFDNKAITPKQQTLINEMYRLATSDDVLTPQQIHQFDQQFSKLAREARYDGVEDIYVSVKGSDGSTVSQPIHEVFRDVYRQKLSTLSPQIQEVNRAYAVLRNIQDDIESTITKQSKNLNIDVDASESASIQLRRIFSNAASQPEYRAIAQQMDELARGMGYNGANAEDLMEFYLKDIKPIYPETVQPASFEGGIASGIRGALSNVLDLGRSTSKDQQRAMKVLIGSDEAVPTPKAPIAEEVSTESTAIRQQIEENLNESLSPSITDNSQAGFISVGKKIPAREKALLDYVKEQEKVLSGMEARGKTDTAAYKKVQATIGEARKMLDEVTGKAESATTKTNLKADKFTNKEMQFVYNNQKADFGEFGGDLAQDVEPAGRYMNVGFDEFPGGENMTKGEVTFKKPLVIDWETSRSGGWKTKLSEQYDGKTGKELSQAIIDDGYDGIIAVTDDVPKEAVNLQTFRGTKTNLLEEAKGQSWGDFLKSKMVDKKPLYHGSDIEIKKFRVPKEQGLYGEGVYFYNNEVEASNFVSMVDDAKITRAFPIADNFATNTQFDKFIKQAKASGMSSSKAKREASKQLKKEGYIGIEDDGLYVIFDADNVKSISEMEDIWKQANAE